MTYSSANEYVFADRIKRRVNFNDDILRNMSSSSTKDLMRRASMGKDPAENCAEEAFRENYRNTLTGYNAAQTERGYNAVHKTARQSTAGSRVFSSGNGRFGHSERYETRGYAKERGMFERYGSYGRTVDTAGKTHKKTSVNSMKSQQIKGAAAAHDKEEIKIKGKRFPFGFIAITFVFTMMIMCLVFNFSEVYKTANEVSSLENKLDDLNGTAHVLELQLEEKNDVRTIEELASKKLGMVKEESVQRKYVSLSEGERIDVLDAGVSENEETAGGVMLSSLWSSLEAFFKNK